MAHATRWEGHWRRLHWTGYRSRYRVRDVTVSVRLPGPRRVRLVFSVDWLKPEDEEARA
jgi:hypothetical protein